MIGQRTLQFRDLATTGKQRSLESGGFCLPIRDHKLQCLDLLAPDR